MMSTKPLRTSDIAREIGVHVNTIRLYEEQGFLPAIPRGKNGYRQYTRLHLEQARLAYIATHWPYIVEAKSLLNELVYHAAQSNFDMALELAFQYLARVRIERTYAEAALAYLERWAAGHLQESNTQKMNIGQAAHYLDVTIDMLRNWERSGLVTVPRDADNGYRLYSTTELGRLRVIRVLVKSGHSLMAILKMLNQFDSGKTDNLTEALNLSMQESADEAIEVVADRWLVSLFALEDRAQSLIQQVRHLIVMHHSST